MHRQPPLHLLQQIKIPHRFRKLNFSSKPIEKPRPIIDYRGTKASPAISLLLCSGRISDPAEVLSLIRPRPPALLCSGSVSVSVSSHVDAANCGPAAQFLWIPLHRPSHTRNVF